MNRLKWLAFGFAGALALAGALWLSMLIRKGPQALAEGLSAAVGDKLHAKPRVYIRQTVVVEEKRPIAELALVARATDVERRMESDLLFSKARLSLRATFNVKAGFDLRSPQFLVRLDPERKRARLQLPAPRVLSLEMTDYQVLEDKGGWWNHFSEVERETAFRQLQAQAKLEAIRAGILADSKREIQRELSELQPRFGIAFEYAYADAGDSAVPVLAMPPPAPSR